jgi:hypothetical protein
VDFKKAFDRFKKFFQQRTGIAWNDRIAKMGTAGPDRFQYQPPVCDIGLPLVLAQGSL